MGDPDSPPPKSSRGFSLIINLHIPTHYDSLCHEGQSTGVLSSRRLLARFIATTNRVEEKLMEMDATLRAPHRSKSMVT